MHLVTVVICFYNEEAYLDDSINSILAQSYQHWELILVDDGSTDRSEAIASRHAASHPDKIQYVTHPGRANLGISHVRRLGFGLARGRYLTFLDGDDVWLPNKLQKHVAILDRFPEAVAVISPLTYWYPAKRYIEKMNYEKGLLPPGRLVTGLLEADDNIPSPASLLRRDAIGDAWLMDDAFPNIYEDGVIFSKLSLGHWTFYDPESHHLYRMHEKSTTNRMSGLERKRAELSFTLWLTELLRTEKQSELLSTAELKVQRLRSELEDLSSETSAAGAD
jgi:glycosyltransferase involved in cell wall biosynthesis